MTDTIGWGILATGGIAATFTEDLKLLPDARVAAVASRTTERARAFADRFGIPNAHGDWDGLAADESVDIVYIANTHNAHYEAAKRCLEGGKAVLCEKPFTVNRTQAAELIELARQRDLFLMEGMWMRCNPAIRRMTTEVREGVIGPVSLLRADFGIVAPDDPGHRLNDPEQAGGALLDLGVYPVSFAHLALGMPSAISAVGTRTPRGVDATTAVVLGHPNGSVASLSCSMVASAPVAATLSGPLGHITPVDQFMRPTGYLVHPRGGEERLVEVPFKGHGYTHQAIEAMRCLREGLTESPLVTWQDTLEVMTILDAVREQIGVKYAGE